MLELADIFDGTHQTPNYKKEGIPFVSVENISNIYDTTKYISSEDYNELYPIKPQKDDILMTRIGDIGTPALVTTNEQLAFYVSLALIRLKNTQVSPKYLYYYIQTNKFKNELWNRTIHNAFPIKINKNEIGKCKVSYPSMNIQSKLINYMEIIDKKIRLSSEKLTLLKKYKEGIKKYVIKETVKYWKTGVGNARYLSTYLKEVNEYCANDGSYQHVTLSTDGISNKSERYDRDFLVKDENKKYKITHLNQLCYNPANLKFGVICLNKFGDGIFSPIYNTYNINGINEDYLELILTSIDFRKYSLKFQQGTVYERMAVSSEDFCNIKIVVADKLIQNKISMLSNYLNKKISKLEDELTNLNQLKSNLLNNMFI